MAYRRGAQWTVPFILVDLSDGSDITSGASLTTFVWNPALGRVPTTNTASHIAGGLWTIVLVAGETDAEVVALQIKEPAAVTQLISIVPDRKDDVELQVAAVGGAGSFSLEQQTDKPNEVLSATDDFYNGCVLVFNNGALQGQARMITNYIGSSKTVEFSGLAGSNAPDAPFPQAPSADDKVTIIGRIGN